MKNEIFPCLWFNSSIKEAANYYRSVFLGATSKEQNPYVVSLKLEGEKFILLNGAGGPEFTFNPTVSFFVLCETKDEIEQLWQSLTESGKVLMPLDKYPWSEMYGWCADKNKLNWQLMLGKSSDVNGQKIVPSLMFTGDQVGKAEEAINFYTSVFDDSKIQGISRYEEGEGDVVGYIKHAQFNLGDYVMMAMDSSAEHNASFNESISFVVECNTQKEIDYYWNKLTAGGEESMCGWLKDKYGVSWQVTPAVLPKLLADPSKAEKVTKVFMKMRKFDIEELVNA